MRFFTSTGCVALSIDHCNNQMSHVRRSYYLLKKDVHSFAQSIINYFTHNTFKIYIMLYDIGHTADLENNITMSIMLKRNKHQHM